MPPIVAFVVAVAVAVGVPAAIAGVVAIGVLIGTAVIAGAIILSVLLKPKTASNAASSSRLNDQLDPDTFRKVILGQTAAGGDEVFWEVYGSSNKSFDQVTVKASHRITAFVALYLDGVLETFSGASSTGKYSGALSTYTTIKGIHGTAAFGATVGSGSYFTSAATLTGMAARLFKWVYDQTKMPEGVPSRVCDVVKGSPVYDPRKDSTQGGSGTHRANDNTTWTYTDLDSNSIEIGRNNALQMLRYLLGWYNNGVLTDGRGIDPADIDYANWITAANTCESQRYYTDCILSTGDTHTNNEAIIANGAQGILIDAGGLWSYFPAYNDTASIAVALSQDDIISGIQWNPQASMSTAYNQVGGNFIDPSTTSLYVAQPYPTIIDSTYLSTDGGYPKRLTLDFQNVQDPALAQKLARIALNKTRVTGTFQATFNYKALQARTYDCVTLTFPNLGWTNQLFRVMSMSINPNGGIDMSLQTELASIYTGGTVNTYVPYSAPVSYALTGQVSMGTLTLATVQLLSPTTTAYDGIEVSWSQQTNIVKNIEIEYQQNYLRSPSTLNASDWVPTGCTIGTGITDRFGTSTAYSMILTTTHTDEYLKQIVDSVNNYSGKTITFGGWIKLGTLSAGVNIVLKDGAGSTTLATLSLTQTSTWQFFTATVAIAASQPVGLTFFIDPTTDVASGTAGQTVLVDDLYVVLENKWAILPIMQADRLGVVIQNILPANNYVVQGRAITVNNIPGTWSQEIIKTNTYTTATQNKVYSQATDPGAVPDGSIWNKTAGSSYLRIGGTWVVLATPPSTVSDGTVLFTDDNPGTNTWTAPSNCTPHVWIEGWGAGGGGISVVAGKGSSTYYGNSSGGYFKHYVAVTPGVTSFTYFVGTGGAAGSSSTDGGAGTATSVTSPALNANGAGLLSHSALTTPGAPGTASGGSVANTTGNTGQSPTTATGKGSPNGGGDVSAAVGSAPGGGGGGLAGANGRIQFTAKT